MPVVDVNIGPADGIVELISIKFEILSHFRPFLILIQVILGLGACIVECGWRV